MTGGRLILILIVLVLIDAILLHSLTMLLDIGIFAGRLISLAAGAATAFAFARIRYRGSVPWRPGLRPLIVISLALSYGIFVLLGMRSPQVQPLLHLGASWLGALLFLAFGLRRIRRWEN